MPKQTSSVRYRLNGATLIATLVATLAWALATAEPARLRRLARRAVTSLPDHSGDVVLRGVVAAVDVPLIEPASGAACAAMWSRSVDTSEGESTITEVGDAAPFVVRCGDALIAVATTLIEVLADPAQAQTRAHPERHRRDEWITAGVGDAVIVAGVLHPGASSDPYRGTAQLTAAPGRRVIIGLLGTPRSAS